MVERNWSSLALNLSTVTLLKFRTDLGRELNSLGPFIAKDALRRVCMRMGAEGRTLGEVHSLPLLSLNLGVMLDGFGTSPSNTFQVYKAV